MTEPTAPKHPRDMTPAELKAGIKALTTDYAKQRRIAAEIDRFENPTVPKHPSEMTPAEYAAAKRDLVRR
jgi:hypothetical protein